jgi:hypothetical protein
MTDIAGPHPRLPRARSTEQAEYRFYYRLIFALSLPAALVRSLRAPAHGAPRRGLIGEASALAHSVTPYLFKS